MSRAVKDIDYTKFTLPSGTTSDISGLVSPTGETASPTIHLRLDEPVDAAETGIRLSMQAGGAVDDYGQAVAAFSNVSVNNNSSHTAIGVNSAIIPSNAPNTLRVVMEGAVKINNATSGSSAPAGWSLSGADQTLGAWAISDGTITFQLSGNVVVGKTPTIAYNGTDPTFKAVSNGDTITAFSRSVTNNSTDPGGIPSGTSARNLGTIVLGHDPASAAEVTQVVTMIHNTVAAGNVNNFVIGDYFALASVNISAGNNAGGAFSASLTEITGHGRNLDFVLVSKNPYKNKNGNAFDHVIFQSRNVLSAMSAVNAGGHYMNPSNTNVGGYAQSKGRAFVTTQVKAALQTAGIPFNDSSIIPLLTRYVANGGLGGTGRDAITDQIFLPTEYEVFGSNTYSHSSGNAAETSDTQTHWSFYADATSRIKYKADAVAVYWWEASPRASYTTNFCIVHLNGSAYDTYASYEHGIAPAFPIR
jgi:hypothetical protein